MFCYDSSLNIIGNINQGLEKHFGALSWGTLKSLSKTSLWIKYTTLVYISPFPFVMLFAIKIPIIVRLEDF